MPKTYYEIDGLSKSSQEDSFDEGLKGKVTHFDVDLTFKNESLEELLNDVREWIGTDPESVDREAGNGIVNFHRFENADSHSPGNYEKEQWKAGKVKLYSACYTGEVKKITEEEVDLTNH